MRERLGKYLREALDVELCALSPLLGGAIHAHWLIEVRPALARVTHFVLRRDPMTPLGIGLGVEHEAALLRVLAEAGHRVPALVHVCGDARVLGRPFLLSRAVPGDAEGEAIVTHADGGALARSLVAELARLHGMGPGRRDLSFLGDAPADPAAWRIAQYRASLDADPDPHPVAEWGLRWLILNKPRPLPPVLCHGDFRTGNYLVAAGGLAAVLDWEFAGWSDPDEDIGWFCSGCWRFGAYGREAGGIAERTVFYRAYEAAAGRTLDPERIGYWETMAALRWLVIALKQRDRFLRGERSLDLALTGRRVAECELEILRLTAAQ